MPKGIRGEMYGPLPYWFDSHSRGGKKLVCIHDSVNGCTKCRKLRRRATNTAWTARNPDKVKAKNQTWYEKSGTEYHHRRYESGAIDEWQARNPEKVVGYKQRHKGIIYAPGQSKDWLRNQTERCPGCRRLFSEMPYRHMHVDHDHSVTDRPNVRGLLCNRCNNALGLVQDSKETLLNLGVYLSEWESQLHEARQSEPT